MGSAPSKSKTASALTQALRLLSQQDRTEQELDGALARRGFSEPQRLEALGRLRALGFVDDVRLARNRTRSLLRDGGVGRRAVVFRLQARGLSEDQAKEAVAAVSEELQFDEAGAARELLRRRRFVLPIRDPRTSARAARLLESRGFSLETIGSLLGSAPGSGFSD